MLSNRIFHHTATTVLLVGAVANLPSFCRLHKKGVKPPSARVRCPTRSGSWPGAAQRRAKSQKAAKSGPGAREGSKAAKVLDLLKRSGDVTLKELTKATGWQPHSVRGFLSVVGKKMGLPVASAKDADGERRYSVKG